MSDDEEYGSEIDDADLLAVATEVESALVHTSQLQTLPSEASQSLPASSDPHRATAASSSELPGPDDIETDEDADDSAIAAARRLAPAAPRGSLRQTTLFGTQLETEDHSPATQSRWPLANPEPEAPTHHDLDREAAKSFVYPINVSYRDYQFNIVRRALLSNVLCALPTGLGKTFIAATVMLNWFRWAPKSQIAFVAPTKPLVNQQIEACYHTVGIPRRQTAVMTGGVPKALRQEYWEERRVFFLTPQTLQNDIKNGLCDPKRLVLLVVDEAHRATGKYAYAEVVKLIRRENASFRILALTATPGSTVDTVQEVIDSLGIARVEVRTDDSLDIREYVKRRHLEMKTFEMSPEQVEVLDLYCKCLEPMLKKLNAQRAYYQTDPAKLKLYPLMDARKKWAAQQQAAGTHKNSNYWNLWKTFSCLVSLAHPLTLLQTHGVRLFHNKISEMRNSESEESQAYKAIKNDRNFKEMVDRLTAIVDDPNFSGSPKMDYMITAILNHFARAEDDETKKETRIIVFTSFRDSAEEIVRTLKRQQPIIRPHVFVGQQGSAGSAGMTQKEQLDVIRKFQDGTFNTLVATSIGEEGLDIGEVDLIVCYDTSGSGIRLIQRMGRTGRKRNGSVLLLLMKNDEENSYKRAVNEQKVMQSKIEKGTDFTYPVDLSPRIIPQDITPEAKKTHVDIPVENTQEVEKRAPRTRKKAPPKKFFMPEGVKTGFTKASRLGKDDSESSDEAPEDEASAEDLLVPIIPRDSNAGLLTADEEDHLLRNYRTNYGGDTVEVANAGPRLTAFPEAQRRLSTTKVVGHGRASKAFVRLVNRMREFNEDHAEDYQNLFDPELLKSPPKTTAFRPVRPAPSEKRGSGPAKTALATRAGNQSDDEMEVTQPPKKRARKGVENQQKREAAKREAMTSDDEAEEPAKKRSRVGAAEDERVGESDLDSLPDLPDPSDLLKQFAFKAKSTNSTRRV